MAQSQSDPRTVADRQDARGTRAFEEHEPSDENPFVETVQNLRDDGKNWGEIYDLIKGVHQAVDRAAFEERFELVPEWCCRVAVPEPSSTSGEAYEVVSRTAKDEQSAKEKVKENLEVIRVEDVEQTGYCRVG